MNMTKFSLMACGVLLLTACHDDKNATPASAGTITLYATISVSDVMNELIKGYETAHHVKVNVSYAGSSTLAKQIEQGAGADIFVSADMDWAEYLVKADKAQASTPLLNNRLVLIYPKNMPITIDMTAQTLDGQFDGKLCTGQTDSVPVGKYAKQALIAKNWWQGIQGRLVETADVRTALNFVARGECVLGIVYATDAKMSDEVGIAGEFATTDHAPIVYPVVQLTQSTNAHAFYDYLQSDTAKTVYQKYGFGVVE